MQKMRYMTNTNDASVLSTLISFTEQDEVQDGAGLFNDLFLAAGNPTWSTTLSDCSADTVIRAITLGEDIAALTADKGRENRVAEIERTQDKLYPSSADIVPAVKLEEWYTQKLKTVQAKKKASKSSTFSPVGTFSMGLYKGYDPPAEGADNSEQVAKLEEWMDLLNFGIGRQWMDYDTVTMIGQFTRPSLGKELGATDDQSPFSAFNGFVHILCPSGGLSVSNIWDRVFITFDGSPSMSNRMEVLEHMCNTIDYQIQVNTMGDLAFEFPMYDFYPEEFGKYKYTMALSDSLKHHEFNDEGDGNPVTGFRVFGQYKSEDALNEDDSWLQHNLYSVYIKSDFMASKYGVLVEELGIPWAMNAWGTGTTGQQDGSQVPPSDNKEKMSALASFGIIEFTKRIAKMSSMSLNSVYCPFVWPNKPMLNRDIRRMGIMNSVNSSVQINGVCKTGISCEYIRKADTDGSFLNICGAKNTPFSYASKAGLALFPNKAAVQGDKEKPFKQNGDIIYTLDNGFGIEIIMPDEASMQKLFEKYGVNNTQTTSSATGGAVSKKTWSDPQKVYNKFRTLPMDQQNKLNAMANKLCGGDGSLRGWQIYQYMLSESGYKVNNPNPMGGANGLIQFMPATLIQLANSGALKGAPKGLDPKNNRDRSIIASWFTQSPYCVGPNATANQLDLTESYLTQISHGNKIEGLAGLNKYIFLPAANPDPNMSFSDPRQPDSIRKIANKISAANGGVDSLNAMMRLKGFDTTTPPSDSQLETNRLSGVSGSKAAAASAVTAQKAAPPALRTSTATTSSLYVAGVPKAAQKPTASKNIVDNMISSMADPIFNSLGTGINNGVTGYANDKVSQAGVDQAVTSLSKTTSSVVSSTTQSTLEQADSAASNVSVFGYRAMKGGLGLSKPVASSTDTPKAGVTIGR
jgi:hypothetical protein